VSVCEREEGSKLSIELNPELSILRDETIINNPQVGHFLDDPFPFVVESGLAPSSLRILDELLSVLDQSPDLKLVCLEGFNDLREVEQRAGHPVDLIDHHDIDLALTDIAEKPLQGRAVHGPTGKAPVVIERRQHRPAFVLLLENEGRASFTLGIK
jgi:hypothetical protein